MAFTHVVRADTAIILRGESDADVNLDTILAGTRVRAISSTGAYVRVVTGDGRDGLVARERLEAIPAPAISAPSEAAIERVPFSPATTRRAEYVFLPHSGSASGKCPSEHEIDSALTRATALLYSQRGDGTWNPTVPAGAAPAVSPTALVLAALASCGETSDKRLAAAQELVNAHPPVDTIAAAMQSEYSDYANAWTGSKAADKRLFANVVVGRATQHPGVFGPKLADSQFDIISTYYGLLAVQNLEKAGVEVPTKLWVDADVSIRGKQRATGGWDGGAGGNATTATSLATTAAGLLALEIASDKMAKNYDHCSGNVTDAAMEVALRRLDKYLQDPKFDVGSCEVACLIERVGNATGRKYLGGKDWFADIARSLVNKQKADGSWNGDVAETAWAMMFLARGNTPIVINKLSYVAGDAKPSWNERPRDIPHFVEWFGRERCGMRLGWQCVSIDDPLPDLLEAPILYISGNARLDFTDAQLDKLRDYVNYGGMIVGNADCGSRDFAESFEKLGGKLFPKYEFRELPITHPIFADQMFSAKKWVARPKVRGISNGIRELMILLPDADIARRWQQNNNIIHRESFQLGANLFLYAAGHSTAWPSKAERRFTPENHAGGPGPVFKVARLIVGDNAIPEPMAWEQMKQTVADDLHLRLTVDDVTPGEGKLKDYDLVQLTGTTKLVLNAAARNELEAYVDNGGTLLVDAAGGSLEFAAGADNELRAMFPNAAADLATPLDATKLFSTNDGLRPFDHIAYRVAARRALTGNLHNSRLRVIQRNGRMAVFYSREDLTAGMAGVTTDDIIGYDIPTARALVSDIVRYAKRK